MQILKDEDHVEGRAVERGLSAFEIAHFCAKRQAALACGLVQLAYRILIPIDGQRRQSVFGEPERVPPTSTGDVERASLVRQQAGMLHEP